MRQNVIKKSIRRGCALLGALMLTFSTAAAAAPPEATPSSAFLSLDELKDLALRQNPDILTARAEWEAARKKIPQASALPDPMLGFDVMGEMTETRVGPQDDRFLLEQEIPFPLKLLEKRRMAKKEAEERRQQYRAVRRDILNRLENAYYDLYFADDSMDVIDEIHAILKKFEGAAQARYANRAGSQRDVAKAQAEVSLTLEQLFRLRQARATTAALVNALLDRDLLTEIPKISRPAKPALRENFQELLELAAKNRQEIIAREALLEKQKHAKKLARLQYLPDVSVGFSYTRVGSGSTTVSNDGQDSWMIPLRFTIPLWQNRIIPSIQEAQKEIEAAEAKLTGAKNQTFYELKESYERYKTAGSIVTLYETAIVPQAEIAMTADRAGYEAGETDFLNLLDSERVFLNAKLTYVRIYTEMLKAHADIRRAIGSPPSEEEK